MRVGMICEANDIVHRPTRPNHLWTSGHAERMNRIIKEATVKRFHHGSHEQLRRHLADFMAAKTSLTNLKRSAVSPRYEYIATIWMPEPGQFIVNLVRPMPGINT